jgi:hypothetical protein
MTHEEKKSGVENEMEIKESNWWSRKSPDGSEETRWTEKMKCSAPRRKDRQRPKRKEFSQHRRNETEKSKNAARKEETRWRDMSPYGMQEISVTEQTKLDVHSRNDCRWYGS